MSVELTNEEILVLLEKIPKLDKNSYIKERLNQFKPKLTDEEKRDKINLQARELYLKNADDIKARLVKKYAVNQDYKAATKIRALARYYKIKEQKTETKKIENIIYKLI